MLNKAQHDQMIKGLVGLRFTRKELVDTLKTISMTSSYSSSNITILDSNKSNIFDDYCMKAYLGIFNTISMNYKIFYLKTNQEGKILITDTEYISGE